MANMSFAEFLMHMYGGDIKVELVIGRMLEIDSTRTVTALNTLDDLGIRGTPILQLYEDCGYNADNFFRRVENKRVKKYAK